VLIGDLIVKAGSQQEDLLEDDVDLVDLNEDEDGQ